MVLLVTMNYSGVIGHNGIEIQLIMASIFLWHCSKPVTSKVTPLLLSLLVTMNYSGVIGHNELQWCYWSQ